MCEKPEARSIWNMQRTKWGNREFGYSGKEGRVNDMKEDKPGGAFLVSTLGFT